jgi:ankyrin repeat protein
LNKPYKNDETLFRFAITNVDDSDASLELIRAMLAAGANPNYPPTAPLYFAISSGPRMTKLLLQAGADPNALDSADRPLWWSALSASKDDDLTTLRLLLDHGADIKKRDREGGPVAWAAYQKSWRALWLLIERGADWKDEKEFGSTVQYMLAYELNYRQHSNMAVPEELRKALAKYETATE